MARASIRSSEGRQKDTKETAARRHHRLEEIAQALRDHRGLVAPAAAQLGMRRTSLYKRVRGSARLQAVLAEAREALLDLAEARLFAAVDRGEGWAVAFVLRTPGRDRGYTARTEVAPVWGAGTVIPVAYVDREAPDGGG